jgi:site-specific DNA-adenine methylase
MCDFYYSYFGGKRSEYIHIKGMVADFVANGGTTFVEPFCGSCATSLKIAKDYEDIKFHVNDIDSYYIRLLSHIKEKGTAKHLFDYTNEKNKNITKEIFKQGVEANKNKTATVEEQFYYCKVYEIRKYAWMDGANIINKERRYSKNYLKTDQFFSKATITCSDYTSIMEQYHDDPTACLYFDPPYLDSANTGYSGYEKRGGGEILDNTKMYVDFVNFFDTCKCKFIMIINSNAMNRYLYAPHIEASYSKQYGTTIKGAKRSTSHLVISNITARANDTVV